jgi:hypothetical protein
MSNALEETTAPNSAVTRCSQAMEHAYRAILSTRDEDEPEVKRQDRATEAAQRAYCKAMPPLSGSDNIRNFIACVANGMLLNVFTGAESTRLLYAAQVAGSAAKASASRAKSPAA